MAIPGFISRISLLKAIRHIDLHGYRARRESTKFDVLYGGKRYPPKMLISLAHRIIKGYPFSSNRFSGGRETNSFLQKRGFPIVAKKGSSTRISSGVDSKATAMRLVQGRLYRWAQLRGSKSLPPKKPGIYAWYFRSIPPGVPTEGCYRRNKKHLLYIGISPEKMGSDQTLRDRIKYHYQGNAEGSTLRLTLGCLLGKKLGIELRRVGSGKRMTFRPLGEAKLNQWMWGNAFVAWTVSQEPKRVEEGLIQLLKPPLNIKGNSAHKFYRKLKEIRSECKRKARSKIVVKG